jgi:hypothetical protein
MFRISDRPPPSLLLKIGSISAVRRDMKRAFWFITLSTSEQVYVDRSRNAGSVMGFPPTLFTRIEIWRWEIEEMAAVICSGVAVRAFIVIRWMEAVGERDWRVVFAWLSLWWELVRVLVSVS